MSQGRNSGLRCIERLDARVSLRYRHGELDVMIVEIDGSHSLTEPSLASAFSWHLVMDGQAVIERGDERWELLPDEALELPGGEPFTILNPSRERLRLVSVVLGERDE